MYKHDKAYEIMLNLAYRLRMARKAWQRAKTECFNNSVVNGLEWAMWEAHNSFQAAKQIYYSE
jgi:hypothetical protein